MATRARSRFRHVCRAVLARRCPACGRGRLFRSWFRMATHCPSCGLRLEREEGYFLGSMYVTFLASYLPAAALYVLGSLWLGWSDARVLAGVILFALAAPLVIWPWSRALWIGFDQLVEPRERPDRSDDPS